MKKTFYCFIAIAISYIFSSCKIDPNAGGPAVANCDDTETPINVQMQWGAQYETNFINLPPRVPPVGLAGNGAWFLYAASYPTIPPFVDGTSSNPNLADFYCLVTVTSACTRNGGSTYHKTYVWKPAGATLSVKSLKNEDSLIKIEYYLAYNAYSSSSGIVNKHPLFCRYATCAKACC